MNPGDASTPKVILHEGLYAHSLPKQPIRSWQRLDDHLYAVARRAAQFTEAFSSGDWAWNAGVLHDLGKASAAFQAYFRRLNDERGDTVSPRRFNSQKFNVSIHSEGCIPQESRVNDTSINDTVDKSMRGLIYSLNFSYT